MQTKGAFTRHFFGSQPITRSQESQPGYAPARHLCPENLMSMQKAVDSQLRGLMDVNAGHVLRPPFVHRPEPQPEVAESRPLFLKAV